MFRPVEQINIVRFNSDTSCKFIEEYEAFWDNEIQKANIHQPSRTFAPSSIRCPRISWFRLRGVPAEAANNVDRVLNFSAQIGTSCHAVIQSNLESMLGDAWIDVEAYMKSKDFRYSYTCEKCEHETRIEIQDPPVKFAPDGIIFYKGEYRLLEIKTSEYSSFDQLTNPKSVHMDQVKCYCTLLDLDSALVLYQDRQYGSLKCYEVKVPQSEKDSIWAMFEDVMLKVKQNIAPPRLPIGDSWCTSAHCRYYNKCKEW